MKADDYIVTKYLEVKQPIGNFYVCVLKYSEVLAVAKADVRVLADEDSIDSYIGIQRKLSKSRLKEISQYVKTIDATFPTSIILSIKTLDEDGVSNKNIFVKNEFLYIKREETVASVLDGQHRIEGIREADSEVPDFDLNVTIFVDADIDDQAQIFSVINKAQTKVNKSLVYDLYEYATHRSPQKTCHDIVRALNRNSKSPFHKKIKILGTANDTENETIAQATLVELIQKYISRNPMKDRDDLRRGFLFKINRIEKATGPDEKALIFRNLFIEEKDAEITKILVKYFEAVRLRWPHSWDENESGNVLNKTTGVVALMKFLRDVFNEAKEKHIAFEIFTAQILKSVKIQDKSITRENYPPGTTGQSKLYNELKSFL